MSEKSIINTKRLDKQLAETEKTKVKYTKQREVLKDTFISTYDKPTVIALLKLIMETDLAREEEKIFAKEFERSYESGNFDETQIRQFKKLFIQYKDNMEKEGVL